MLKIVKLGGFWNWLRSRHEVYDTSSRGVRSQRNAFLAHTVSVCIETVSEFLAKYNSGKTKVLEWITHLEDSTTVSRLIAETRDIKALNNTD